MQERLSNNIKALLITEDLSEVEIVSQNSCFTLQHFNYDCNRCRNEMGEPYGPTVSVILQFSIRTLTENGGKIFYERLKSTSPYSYTFIFNATFNANKQLSGYEDAMIVSGYVIDIEESFYSATSGEDKQPEQMLMSAKLLLQDITYIGKNSNKTLSIIH